MVSESESKIIAKGLVEHEELPERYQPTNPSPEQYHDVVFLVEHRVFGKPKNVAQAAQDLEVKIRALWSIPERKEGEVRIVEALQDHTISSVLEATNIANDRKSFLLEEIERQAREKPLKQMPIRESTTPQYSDLPYPEVRVHPDAVRIIREIRGVHLPETPPSRQGPDRRPPKEVLTCGCCGYGLDPNGFEIRVHNHDNCAHSNCSEGFREKDNLKGLGDKLSCGCCMYERDPDGNSMRIHDHDKCRHQLCPDREGVSADIDVAGMDDATFLAATNPDETSWIHKKFQEDEMKEVTTEQFERATEIKPRLDGPSTDRTDPRCPDHGRRSPCQDCDPYIFSQQVVASSLSKDRTVVASDEPRPGKSIADPFMTDDDYYDQI